MKNRKIKSILIIFTGLGCVGVIVFVLYLLFSLVKLFKTSNTPTVKYFKFDVSPDGNTIIFPGVGNGIQDLYLYDKSRSKVTRLTNTPTLEAYPHYTHDGKGIIFSRSQSAGYPFHLALFNLKDNSTSAITDESEYSDYFPTPTKDDKRIVFARASTYRNYSLGGKTWDNYDLFVVDRDGANLQQITTEHFRQITSIAISADGKNIYFAGEKASYPKIANDWYEVSLSKPYKLKVVLNMADGGEVAVNSTSGAIAYVSDSRTQYNFDLTTRTARNARDVPANISINARDIENIVYAKDGMIYFTSGFEGGFQPIKAHLMQYDPVTKKATKIIDSKMFDNPLK